MCFLTQMSTDRPNQLRKHANVLTVGLLASSGKRALLTMSPAELNIIVHTELQIFNTFVNNGLNVRYRLNVNKF